MYVSTDPNSPSQHQFIAKRCTVKTAQTLVECDTVEGVRKDFSYRVTIADQLSNVAALGGSYMPPNLYSLERRKDTPFTDADTRGFILTTVGNSSVEQSSLNW